MFPTSYGIQMAFVNLSMHSITEGEFTFSGLDVRYTADFLVNANPSLTGNLSNALNQQMTAGSGTFQIPLQFNTSANGSFVISAPTSAMLTAPQTLHCRPRRFSTWSMPNPIGS